MTIPSRLQNLRQKLVAREVDGLLVSQPENRFYLSGFNGSAGLLLVTARQATLATDFRYIEQAKMQSPGYDIFKIIGDMSDWLPKWLAGSDIKRLGFEAGHLTVAAYNQMKAAMGKLERPVSLVPLEGVVDALRAVKEPEEIELITRAVAITDRAYQRIDEVIHVGMTELDLAWEIEKFLRENGSQTVPFELIVASGPNAALPHARPSARTISAGEPVIIDIGARVNGYSSDETRTICVGTPGDTFRKVYDTVLGAQLTAIETIKADMTGEQADNLARVVIKEAGHGEEFGHSLGHGLGLATHELPRLGQKSTDVLEEGTVFTIEPGIYLPGWGGVRIEDVAIIEAGKVRIISKARKT